MNFIFSITPEINLVDWFIDDLDIDKNLPFSSRNNCFGTTAPTPYELEGLNLNQTKDN